MNESELIAMGQTQAGMAVAFLLLLWAVLMLIISTLILDHLPVVRMEDVK
jgi:hypothetical protein